MKQCPRCELEKEESEFYFKNKKKDILSSYCKICQKEFNKTHYRNNKDSYIKRAKISNEKVKDVFKKHIINYLKEHSCIICGEKDIVVLEFDHRNPKEKKFSIGHHTSMYLNLETIDEEIKKCDVLCANCHRRKTAKNRNYYKSK